MADEKKSGPAQESGAGGNDKGGRRRYFWRKKRGQKATGGEAAPKEPPAAQKRSAPKPANQEKAGNQERGGNEKVDRDQRTRRRRRRPRSRQGAVGEPKVIAPVTPIEDDYVPPKSVFIYTHVVRPDQRDSYEFRAEHFGKVGRHLEDFDIDLSQLFVKDADGQAETSDAEPTGILDNWRLKMPESIIADEE